MIHVAYRLWGGDGFFAKMTATSMLSMFENTKEKVTVHIMHNERLTPDNRGKFCYIAGQYEQQVEFHNVEKIAGATLKEFDEVYPRKPWWGGANASWYPLISYEVFPDLKKIILIGADTIFNLDVGELWNIELNEDFPFAAVPEFTKWGEAYGAKLCYDGLVEHLDYFNADVFLVNPIFFKDYHETILQGCKFCRDKYLLAEQDVLNYLFSKKYQKLPNKFNVVMNWERKYGKLPYHLESAIYHYAGGNSAKPSMNSDDIWDKLWLEYFLKTPYANAEMFGNINKSFSKIYAELKQSLLNFTNLISKRERIFLVDKVSIEAVRNIFDVRYNEEIIDSGDFNKVNTLINSSIQWKGKRIVFIISGNYWEIKQRLSQVNLIENVDFVDGTLFLSKQNGESFDFDSRAIVQEM